MDTKKISLFLSLAFFSLACLSTAAAARTDQSAPAGTPTTLINQVRAIATLTNAAGAPAQGAELCAVVIADTALHLREAGNMHAPSMTHLKRGDVVELIGREDPAWWYLRFEGFEGFARSTYLHESECGR